MKINEQKYQNFIDFLYNERAEFMDFPKSPRLREARSPRPPNRFQKNWVPTCSARRDLSIAIGFKSHSEVDSPVFRRQTFDFPEI